MPFTQMKLKALALAEQRHKAALAKKPKGFTSLAALETPTIQTLIDAALAVKKHPQCWTTILAGKHVALLFEKTSTRTRCSFETGVREMGGDVSYLDWKTSNFVLADLADEAKCLSRYYDIIMARVMKNETIQTMAAYSESPVINGLCDREHPCQALADFMTMAEYFGRNLAGLKLTFIGDGNNVCRSLVHGASKLGVKVTLCAPDGYALDAQTVKEAGALVSFASTPHEAVADADVIYTDTWVSMGDEAEATKRLKAFAGYQVDESVLAAAPLHALVMHCLPAHPGQEIAASVLRGPRSIVFDQAENRKHAQKAVMAWLVEDR